MKAFDLSGRVAVVTGGNGGLGLGMALGLAEAGAFVVIAARREDKAQAALTQLRALGGAAEFVALDVRSVDSSRAMFAQVMARFGRCDILVNNAGMSIRKAPQDLSDAEWREVLDVNLTGSFQCAQAAYPHMKAGGGGKIINLGSMYSLFGAPMVAAYAASKGGVVQMSKALACAWAGDNIQVNTILPGWLDTDLTHGARAQVAGLQESVVARTPAGRWGAPQDLAGVAVFLASSASDFVTGAEIAVDGGYSARG